MKKIYALCIGICSCCAARSQLTLDSLICSKMHIVDSTVIENMITLKDGTVYATGRIWTMFGKSGMARIDTSGNCQLIPTDGDVITSATDGTVVYFSTASGAYCYEGHFILALPISKETVVAFLPRGDTLYFLERQLLAVTTTLRFVAFDLKSQTRTTGFFATAALDFRNPRIFWYGSGPAALYRDDLNGYGWYYHLVDRAGHELVQIKSYMSIAQIGDNEFWLCHEQADPDPGGGNHYYSKLDHFVFGRDTERVATWGTDICAVFKLKNSVGLFVRASDGQLPIITTVKDGVDHVGTIFSVTNTGISIVDSGYLFSNGGIVGTESNQGIWISGTSLHDYGNWPAMNQTPLLVLRYPKLPDFISVLAIKTYPNPANTWITFEPAKGKKVQIYNAMGALVKSVVITDDNQRISTADLSSGIYFAFFGQSSTIIQDGVRCIKFEIMH